MAQNGWKFAWFTRVQRQIAFVNALSPGGAAGVQFIYNPWRFWAPFGVYFRPPVSPGDDCGAELLVKQFDGAKGLEFPKKAGDCGYDLVVNQEVTLKEHASHPTDIPCDFAMKVPDTHFALIINRSSSARRFGLWIVPAVIDSGYTGQIYIGAYNMTSARVTVSKGMRLAQLILLPRFTPQLRFVDELPKTERGSSGFGSTGL